MKHTLRFVFVALIFATTGLFAQASTDSSAAEPQQHQKVAKVVKKTAKKHKKHKKQKAQ